MMMLRTKVTACLLAGLIGTVALGGPLGAAAMSKGKWHNCPLAKTPLGRLITGNIGRLLVLKSELDVTDEQREKIREIVVENKADIATVAQGIFQKKRALRDTVVAEKPDESTIRKAADELGDAIGDAAVLASKLASQVRPILTAEKFFEEAAKAD